MVAAARKKAFKSHVLAWAQKLEVDDESIEELKQRNEKTKSQD